MQWATWFVRIWVGMVVALNLIGLAGFIVSSESIGEAWSVISETYSPYNVWTHGLNLVLLSPALAVVFWRQRRNRR